MFGDYPETMKTIVGSRLPAFTEDESEQVKGALDFVGVINYMALYVKDNSSCLKENLRDFSIDMAVALTGKLNVYIRYRRKIKLKIWLTGFSNLRCSGWKQIGPEWGLYI